MLQYDWATLFAADWSELSTSTIRDRFLISISRTFPFYITMSSSSTNDSIKEQIQEFVDAPKNFFSEYCNNPA